MVLGRRPFYLVSVGGEVTTLLRYLSILFFNIFTLLAFMQSVQIIVRLIFGKMTTF